MDIIKKLTPLGLIAVITGIVIPVCVQAADLHKDLPAWGPIPFASLDLDDSGFITAEEFDAVRSERMAVRAGEGRPMRGMANMTTFSVWDSDGDGTLTPEELITGQKSHRYAHWHGHRHGHRHGCDQIMAQGLGTRGEMCMPGFTDFDIDGDGKVVELEFTEARQQRIHEMERLGRQMKNSRYAPSFTDIDLNGDGEISRDEFAAHQSERRQNMR